MKCLSQLVCIIASVIGINIKNVITFVSFYSCEVLLISSDKQLTSGEKKSAVSVA